jgi:hypothetical protein
MAKKRGRPASEKPKIYQYRLRMSIDDLTKLNECSSLSGKQKAEVFREGMEMFYQHLKQNS